MTRPADPDLVALLLTQRLVEAEASPLKAAEFWAVVERVPDLGALLGLRPDEIREIAQVDESMAQRIGTLLTAATSFAFALDDAHQSGLQLLSGLSEHFPFVMKERLGRATPPLLRWPAPRSGCGPSSAASAARSRACNRTQHTWPSLKLKADFVPTKRSRCSPRTSTDCIRSRAPRASSSSTAHCAKPVAPDVTMLEPKS